MATADRIRTAALAAFATRGYEATSLDDLARELGITKQTILYWYRTKEALLDAVIDWCTAELAGRLDRAVAEGGEGFDRVETVVKAMFRMAARHPSVPGMLREVNRLGPDASARLTGRITPLLDAAVGWLGEEMDAGRLRRHDPSLLVLVAYSAVTGLATDTEALRALGSKPTLGSLIERRNQLLALLRDALDPSR